MFLDPEEQSLQDHKEVTGSENMDIKKRLGVLALWQYIICIHYWVVNNECLQEAKVTR